MNEPERTQWQKRCAFNSYCKRAIEHEAINAYKRHNRRRFHEVTFSDMTPSEESQISISDEYFKEEDDESIHVGGKSITPKLLAEAIGSLSKEKRTAVLLYYFRNKTDVEIAEMLHAPRSTIQYRRTSSFEILKKYLEEHADDWDDW